MGNNIICGNTYIEVTSLCNRQCVYCYNDSGDSRHVYLAANIIYRCLTDLIALSCRTLTISGGEPFLHPDIDYIIEKALEMGINVKIVTNGSLLSATKLKEFLRAGCTFQFTLDSHLEGVNDLWRGESSFQKTISLIRAANEIERGNMIVIRMNVNKLNYNSISTYVESMERLGVKCISISLLQPSGRALDSEMVLSYSRDTAKIWRTIEVCKKIKNEHTQMHISFGENDRLYSCAYNSPHPVFRPAIDFCGNVYLCQMFRSCSYPIGNIYDSLLSDILQNNDCNQLIQRIRERKQLRSECASCFLSRWCTCGCPAFTMTHENSMFSTDEQCKMLKYITAQEVLKRAKQPH